MLKNSITGNLQSYNERELKMSKIEKLKKFISGKHPFNDGLGDYHTALPIINKRKPTLDFLCRQLSNYDVDIYRDSNGRFVIKSDCGIFIKWL